MKLRNLHSKMKQNESLQEKLEVKEVKQNHGISIGGWSSAFVFIKDATHHLSDHYIFPVTTLTPSC